MSDYKYSLYCPVYKKHAFIELALASVLNAMGERDDVELIISDDSIHVARQLKDPSLYVDPKIYPLNDKRIKYYVPPVRLTLINKMGIGLHLAKGKYFCPADDDCVSHPRRFEILDKLLEKYFVAAPESSVYFDSRTGRAYRIPEKNFMGTYNGIEFPRLHDFGGAIPLDWLRRVGYDGGERLGMGHSLGGVLIESPVWIQMAIEGRTYGLYKEVDPDAWKGVIQIFRGDNENNYSEEFALADKGRSGMFERINWVFPKADGGQSTPDGGHKTPDVQ